MNTFVTPFDVLMWLVLGAAVFAVLFAYTVVVFEYIKNVVGLIVFLIPECTILGAMFYYAAKYLILLRLIK